MDSLFSGPEAPSIPPPPVAPDPDKNADTQAAMAKSIKDQASRKGRASTLLTSPSGVDTSTATISSKSLLGA